MNHIRIAFIGFVAVCICLASCKTEPKESEDLGALATCERTNNEVVLRLEAEPDILNPLITTTSYANQLNFQIFSYLLTLDPESLELIPQLAKARPTIEFITDGPYAGGTNYQYEIHEEAVWEDGSPVTGHDYAFTLKAVLNPDVSAVRLRPHITLIKDVIVDESNPKSFTVVTDKRFFSGEEKTASTFSILPEKVYDPNGYLKDIPVAEFTDAKKLEALAAKDERLKQFADEFQSPKYGREAGYVTGSGPYRFVSWETGQELVLEKKENWWGDALASKYRALQAYPDKLIYKPIKDGVAAIQGLKGGALDVVPDIEAATFVEMRDDPSMTDCFEFYSPSMLAVAFIYVNQNNPKLADKRVRQALAHAIDVSQVIEKVYFGMGERLASPVHPAQKFYNDDLALPDYNAEKAKTLLAEAGWTDTNSDGTVDKEIDGERVELVLTYSYSNSRASSERSALIIQESARRAGVKIELDAGDFRQLIGRQRAGDYELSGAARSLAPNWEPRQNYHTEGDNRTGFGNAETDALINKIQETLDDEERYKLYKELQAIIYDERPEIYIMTYSVRFAIHKRFDTPITAYFPGYFPNYMKLRTSEMTAKN